MATTAPNPSPAGPPPAPEVLGDNREPNQDSRLSTLLSLVSTSWLASLCVHFILVLLLALWSLPALPSLDLPALVAQSTDDSEEFDDVPLIEFDQTELEPEITELTPQPVEELVNEVAESVSFEAAAPSMVEMVDLGLTSPVSNALSEVIGAGATQGLGRGERARAMLVRSKGGSDGSERAVTQALEWLARHQNPDGTWSLIHTAGVCRGRCANPGSIGKEPASTLRAATGLALLPFLGAGQTHQTGKHKDTVARGLNALVALGQQKEKIPGVDWSDPIYNASYSHAIATLVLAEALGITGDYNNLQPPAQAGLDFIAYSQGPRGGWWYKPKRPGDTSVTGWQLQALKSGFIANLNVSPLVAKKGFAFLDAVSHDGGAQYSYAPPDRGNEGQGKPKNSMSAVGLLCRMYLGWEQDNPALARGVQRLAEIGPSEKDYYYNYYAAQVLFQYTNGEGPLWREWNTKLRDMLISAQATEGHERGSWYTEGRHAELGGRLYITSLAAMTLEVYYRYLPIYKLNTADVEFPE